MKTCSKCQRKKPFSFFYRNRARYDGLQTKCKKCIKEWDRMRVLSGENRRRCKNRILSLATQARQKEKNTRWRYENRPLHREINRHHYRNNKDQYYARVRARRARKIGNGGSHTDREWLALCEKYGHVCLSCLIKKKLVRDHVIPLSKGGTDDISNIQPLCGFCNGSKHDKATDYRLLWQERQKKWNRFRKGLKGSPPNNPMMTNARPHG